MKQITLTAITAGLFLLFVAALPQEKQGKGVSQQKHVQMMEMMKDSSAVDMMMEHIASDSRMRMSMMRKMMQHAKSDTASMMEMCKAVMAEKDMHSCMMKMMGGGMMEQQGGMQRGGMMMHEMMGKSSPDSAKGQMKGATHEQHHKKD